MINPMKKKERVLVSWIGANDLKSLKKQELTGPVFALLTSEYGSEFDEIYLLYTQKLNEYRVEDYKKYFGLIKELTKSRVNPVLTKIINPMDYFSIYSEVVRVLDGIEKESGGGLSWSFHTSPGTQAMASIWVLLGKTRYKADLFYSWVNGGVQEVKKANIPFDIYFDFLPELIKNEVKNITGSWSEIPQFKSIIHRDLKVAEQLNRAHRIGMFDVPAIIIGETGTGKELVARAIHKSSSRKDKPFVSLNCGAIPDNLLEVTLFGCVKGAYTGADFDREGVFEKANGGIVFFDEIGELKKDLQVKLLRVIQEGSFHKVGDHREVRVDVRILAATNRDLERMVYEKKFRADLFHRIAIGIIKLPALRDRGDDAVLLAQEYLNQINKDFKKNVTFFKYSNKVLSSSAMNFIKSYFWPGNVRELINTLKRICLWIDREKIDDRDLEQAIVKLNPNLEENHPLLPAQGLDMDTYILNIEKVLAIQAIQRTRSKAKAAKLLGLKKSTFEKRCREQYQI
jgi:DNA-binding NtrC family response regulator